MSRPSIAKLAEFARRGMLGQREAERLCKRSVKVTPGKRGTPGILKGMEIRPSKDVTGLNKTEAAFLVRLRADKWPFIAVQGMTFKLGDDCRYTPDFITVDEGVIVAWEVKGFWRDDARVKIMTAARAYPFIQFIAVSATDKKLTGWTEEDIAP